MCGDCEHSGRRGPAFMHMWQSQVSRGLPTIPDPGTRDRNSTPTTSHVKMEVGCVRRRQRVFGLGLARCFERATSVERVKLCTQNLRLWCFGLSEEWARRNSEARRLCLHNLQVPLGKRFARRVGEERGKEKGRSGGNHEVRPGFVSERAVDFVDSRNPLCFLQHFVGGRHSTLASALRSSRLLILRGALGFWGPGLQRCPLSARSIRFA